MPTALITEATGQDGSYLAELLLGGAASLAAVLIPLGMAERRVATLREG